MKGRVRVRVVHGPPLSGKTTYVQERMGPNDLVYDFDLIMSAMSGLPVHGRNDHLISYVLDIRDLIIARLKGEKNIDTAWIVTTFLPEKLKQSLIGLNAEYIELKISIFDARERLCKNPGHRDIERWEEAIDKYFALTADHSDFYNSKRWKRKRMVILKRDDFKCREAARFGRVEPADTVHHCIPISERPDLKLDSRNLIALSEENHDRMHLRIGAGLSRLGEEWKERTLKKYPELSAREESI